MIPMSDYYSSLLVYSCYSNDYSRSTATLDSRFQYYQDLGHRKVSTVDDRETTFFNLCISRYNKEGYLIVLGF